MDLDKHRPYTFADVVGQAQAVAILRGRAQNPRGTYLLEGPYGTGKTTLARIFARVINCRDPQTCTRAAPCTSCAAFEGIAKGSKHPNIIEVNGGDAKGIDDVRSLIEQSRYRPMNNLGYRVFIIDEIHQLTSQAQDALLKSFEEPTATTVWMMATNYPEKIKVALTSRAIKASVALLSTDEIRLMIDRAVAAEGMTVDPAAVLTMANAAGGHGRDAMNMLTSYAAAASVGAGFDVGQWIKRTEAASPTFLAFKYVQGIVKKNPTLAFGIPAQVEYYQRFMEDVIDILRGLIYVGVGATELVQSHRHSGTIAKVPITAPEVGLLAKLLDMHVRGLMEMKQYTVSDKDYVSALAARSYVTAV